MRRIAIIPARGGSKRHPRKNIVDFHGSPIISYPIRAALDSGQFEKVVVSTEDEEIAGIAAAAGAEIVDRPEELATDTARVVDVCLHVLDVMEQRGEHFDVMFCIYATAPLITGDDIVAMSDIAAPGKNDFVMAVTDYPFPPHQAMRMDEDGRLQPMWPEMATLRSQEVGDTFIDNGTIYATSAQAFRKHRSFRGDGVAGYFIPRSRSVDIDTREDLEMALYFASRQNR